MIIMVLVLMIYYPPLKKYYENPKQVFTDAQTNHTALPSFNIDTFEIYQAVESVVKELNLPCLVQLSEGEDKFIQAERLFMLVKKAQTDGLPIYLNMDHGKKPRSSFSSS